MPTPDFWKCHPWTNGQVERMNRIIKDTAVRRYHYQSPPLFDTDLFRRYIESAYITMYERYQRSAPPQSFSVKAVQPMRTGER